MASFGGRSYMLLRRLAYMSRDVSLLMIVKPLRSDGLLVYSSQYDDGSGDFISVALRHGHVEFRYTAVWR